MVSNDNFIWDKVIIFILSLLKDIIFDPSLIPFLVRAVKSLWLNQRDRQSLNFIVASTIRNEETYAIFLRELSKWKYIENHLEKGQI